MYQSFYEILTGNTHDNLFHLILINISYHMYCHSLLCALSHEI